MLELDRLFGTHLLNSKLPNVTKETLALEEASRLKRAIGHARHLKRKTDSSLCEEVFVLKRLMTKRPGSESQEDAGAAHEDVIDAGDAHQDVSDAGDAHADAELLETTMKIVATMTEDASSAVLEMWDQMGSPRSIAELVLQFADEVAAEHVPSPANIPPLYGWISNGITNWIYPDPNPFVSQCLLDLRITD